MGKGFFHTKDFIAIAPFEITSDDIQRELVDIRNYRDSGNLIIGRRADFSTTFQVTWDGVVHCSGVQITSFVAGTLVADASGNISSVLPNLYQAHPADPAGATGVPPVMMGLAASITPVGTAVKATLSGNLTSGAIVGQVELRNGTGTAPANGAAPVGTSPIVPINGIASTTVPFSTQYALNGLTPGVALWFDAKLAGGLASTTTITNLSITLEEIR